MVVIARLSNRAAAALASAAATAAASVAAVGAVASLPAAAPTSATASAAPVGASDSRDELLLLTAKLLEHGRHGDVGANTSAALPPAAMRAPSASSAAAHRALGGMVAAEKGGGGGDAQECAGVAALPAGAAVPRRLGGALRRDGRGGRPVQSGHSGAANDRAATAR